MEAQTRRTGALEPEVDYSVVIGDVVKSRKVPSQEKLLADLQEAHQWVNGRVPLVEPMTSTLGDEFQGVYSSLRDALKATLFLRLRLFGRYDLRFGIGRGAVATVAPEKAPLAQSGPGWWHARTAIEEAAALAGKQGWPRSVRTRLRGVSDPWGAAVHAFLLCQDHLLASMDEKDARITLGLFEGRTQSEMSKELNISQSSISRRQSENGASALFRAHQELEDLIP